MDFDHLTLTFDGHLARITLNRPEVLNSLNAALRAEITDAVDAASKDARAIVLTGAGRGFCAGQDLGEGGTAASVDLERTLREEYQPMLEAIHNAPVPVIAAVNGVAAGAGANLALACDVVIACESASFIQAFSRIGLIPDAGGTYWLPRQVGFARAMGAALFAEPVTARQAEEWGMIWEAVPDADFEARVTARAQALAEGPTQALAAAKRALRASFDNARDAQLDLEAELQGQAGRTRDFVEGVMAYAEKRPPRFEGR